MDFQDYLLKQTMERLWALCDKMEGANLPAWASDEVANIAGEIAEYLNE